MTQFLFIIIILFIALQQIVHDVSHQLITEGIACRRRRLHYLHYTTLLGIALHYSTLHQTTMKCSEFTSLHYTTLGIALHYLHYY